jgi:hypothetical protein
MSDFGVNHMMYGVIRRPTLCRLGDMEIKSMFDQLEMALRRYKQIAPNPSGDMNLGQADQLSDWLENDVGRIVELLFHRPGFRVRAQWSLTRLTGNIAGPEREAVIAVDKTIVHYAGRLLAFAKEDAIYEQLRQLGPYQNHVEKGDPSALESPHEDSSLPRLPIGLRAVESIANRPWRDLASTRDFFRPTSQLNLTEPDEFSWGMFLSYVDPRLLVPGDYISRCTEIRIKFWLDSLQQLFIRCHTALPNTAGDLKAAWAELSEVRSQFNSSFDALRQLCFQGDEARLRDSCVALLQIYVGFHSNADLSWLGEVAAMARTAGDIPHRVKYRHEWHVPERATAALVDIAEMVRNQPPEDLIEEMKATKRLVLIEEQRTGYFDGIPIELANQDAQWHVLGSNAWELLWTLADRASVGRLVDPDSLSNPKALETQQPPTVQAVKDRRSLLKKRIVRELNDLIVSAGPGSYRLKLERSEICLLGWTSDEYIDVLMPSPPRHSDSSSPTHRI